SPLRSRRPDRHPHAQPPRALECDDPPHGGRDQARGGAGRGRSGRGRDRRDGRRPRLLRRRGPEGPASARRGAGAGRGFCAGGDLKDRQAIGEGRGAGAGSELRADPGDPAMGASFRGPWSYLLSVRKAIVAGTHGPVAGLGLAAALFAALRFASERATFTTAFVRRGLIAEWGIGWTLPRLVGSANALDVLWSGRVFDAAEALRMG